MSGLIFIVALVYVGTFGTLLGLRFLLRTEYPLAVVEGNSMNPTFLDGDLLVIRGEPAETITVGTVIVFHSPNEYDRFIVHRVVDIIVSNGQVSFVTKGDNNWLVDPWRVPERNVVGVVLYRVPSIAPLGKVLLLIQTPAGRIATGTLIVLILVADLYYENRVKKSDKGASAGAHV
ncbi:MAG: signal peptidase I [Candidatus Bathyarchaeia archaeon]